LIYKTDPEEKSVLAPLAGFFVLFYYSFAGRQVNNTNQIKTVKK
jgi:hypothetical protein